VQGVVVVQDLAEGLEMDSAIQPTVGGLQRYFLVRQKGIHGVSLSEIVGILGYLGSGV